MRRRKLPEGTGKDEAKKYLELQGKNRVAVASKLGHPLVEIGHFYPKVHRMSLKNAERVSGEGYHCSAPFLPLSKVGKTIFEAGFFLTFLRLTSGDG